MSGTATSFDFVSPLEQLQYAREIIRLEAQSLEKVATRIGAEFCDAVSLILNCRGIVVVTGMGKAGLIGQKVSATLASTGTRSLFLHPAEAVHGDLGRVREGDLVLALSQSGETEEIVRLLPSFKRLEVPVIAVTSQSKGTLARGARIVICIGPLQEACSLGLAPSTSTTAILAVGDALAFVSSRMRNFGRTDFAQVHPAGALGKKLARVEDKMRPLDECRVASDRLTVRDVFVSLRTPGRRSGAIMLVGEEGRLTGIYTDSDLARLFENRLDAAIDEPISNVMVRKPKSVVAGSYMADAETIFGEYKISELPVTNHQGCPIGLLDITDVFSSLPSDAFVVR